MTRDGPEPIGALVARASDAQRRWAAVPITQRLGRISRLRHLISKRWPDLARPIGSRSGRVAAEALACEIVPLADACRFVEREAEALLHPRPIGRAGRPAWLFGCSAEIRREPIGVVLVIGPGNYPLYIPGVQLIQGLVAGNAVILKPGRGGHEPLAALLRLTEISGIDPALTPLLGEEPEFAEQAIAAGVDKVFLTGSSETGAKVLANLAPQLTPAVMELAGNDPVFILDGADLEMAVDAIAYGLRLNGSATCIAPRRVYIPAKAEAEFIERCCARFRDVGKVLLEPTTAQRLSDLLGQAVTEGASLIGARLPIPTDCPPLLLTGVKQTAEILRSAIFAPIISVLPVGSAAEALVQAAISPYALGASVFGPARAARAFAAEARAGIVTINDMIVPSADPRLPFGGRGRSGFGSTRGREGLLEMTAIKTVAIRSGRFRPHFRRLEGGHTALFESLLQTVHAAGAAARARAGLRLLAELARWRLRSSRRSVNPSFEHSAKCLE